MTLKSLFKWYFSTLLIGASVTCILGLVSYWITGSSLFGPVNLLLLTGLLLPSITQLGFFSYLVFNWLSMGLVRNQKTFNTIQVFFLLVVFGCVVYLNVNKYNGTDLWMHLSIPIILFVVSVIIGKQKVRFTQKAAFIPTLFFMFTVTMLEAIPTMNIKGGEAPVLSITSTVFVLVTCNAWQILNLQRWTRARKEEKSDETPSSVTKQKKKS
ncbi:KinB-signaling pathway activation protein [Thermoactinomyces sp. DSM 45892]|uniref:KinB-signaling pathway activation protein n=1 Tax=Thermoactinomyces sp. DSM 45892 TaxID=1882753 RepID=UPI00089B8CB0|nr:KinB-signaling pathway activation protein [Thermoactinomyces sp. DSM 45892]SDY91642.1 KinB signaling pathway activation protein [Thermoactinomyces sp. DSM 45892]